MFRYEDRRVDEYGGVAVRLYEHRVLKTTPCGAWIDHFGARRFVKSDARKRFACPTKEEAMVSFIARKRRQAAILRGQLDGVEEALRKAKEMCGGVL